MLKKIILFSLILGFTAINAQSADDLVDRIELKLRKDKNYLNLHYIMLYPSAEYEMGVRSFPRTKNRDPYQIKFDENITYRLVFLKEGLGIDSLFLLYMDEIEAQTQEEEGLFGGLNTPQDDTTKVLTFEDIYNLKLNYPAIYDSMYQRVERYIDLNPDNPPSSLLGINPDQQIKTTLGVSSRDNTDYFNYVYAHSVHWFPGGKKVQTVSRRGQTQGQTDFKIDISFSKLGFSHEFMHELLEEGAASIEVSAREEVINVLPWESNALSAGLRMLFLLSAKDKVQESTFMNALFGARFGLGTKTLYENQPYILGNDPLLNFPTAFITELNFTRLGNLPFLNFYLSAGDPSYADPLVSLPGNDGTSTAYFTTTQGLGYMSFFWNTSDELTSRLRLDLGAGYFDIVEASYSSNGDLEGTNEVKNDILPMAKLSFTWAPRGNPLLSAEARFLDSIIRMKGWLTVLRIQPNHTFRVEATYITQPVFRKSNPWENDGGAMIELRYRYGL